MKIETGGSNLKVIIEELTKIYPNGTQALHGVNLEISNGMFGLLGPNGAGKTTLMRILATLLAPTSGKVFIDGKELREDPAFVRTILGYLPQEFRLYPRFNAVEFIDYVALLKGLADTKGRKRKVQEVLERVNLWDVRKRRIGGYSGGMKRRLGIAQALVGDPKLLIVDEPTAGLDPEERIRFRNLLAELSADRVVILSTHIVADIESSCYRLAVLDHGRVRFIGEPGELAGAAEGKVWTAKVNDQKAQELRDRGQVLASKRLPDGFRVRVIAEKPPVPGAEQQEAGLEEGYMVIMHKGGEQ